MNDDATPDVAYPVTPWSLIARGIYGEDDASRAALRELLSVYWEPVYCTIRDGYGVPEDTSRQLCERFLSELIHGDALADAAATEMRFRTFLQQRLDTFMAAEPKPESPPKPSGITIDAVAQSVAGGLSPAAGFAEQWVLVVFKNALQAAQQACSGNQETRYSIFKAVDVDGSTASTADLAAQFGVDSAEVRTALNEVRRLFRAALASAVYAYVDDQSAAEDELRWLLGERAGSRLATGE